MSKVLVTGAAGFIGFNLTRRLISMGETVVGIDNLNAYYDVKLKKDRLALLQKEKSFSFHQLDLADQKNIAKIFKSEKFDKVVNLAAQAGVRYSLENPHAYVDSNVTGFLNILEGSRHNNIKHLVFASTSSVYGNHTHMPFTVHESVDHPITIYAATKKANELMAHSYSHLFKIPVTGLRFFTVYGPWGRPDMALFLFTKAILEGKPIDVFNHGNMKRDFTYIDDIVAGIIGALNRIPQENPGWDSNKADPATSSAPYQIYNIGAHEPVDLMRFIDCIENELGIKAKKNFLSMQAGDVPATFADVLDLQRDVGYQPKVRVEEGVANFIKWYREYYKV